MKRAYKRWGAGFLTRWIYVLLAGALLSAPQGARAQTPVRRNAVRQRTVPKAATSPGVEEPKFKGIWEPVSYPEDILLLDVFFANRNVGWAIGGRNAQTGGVVLYTADGGEHWSVSLGDTQSNDKAYRDIRFTDARHGWMWQGKEKLLRTVDGQNWEVAGNFHGDFYDYTFASPSVGLMSSSDKILRTVDGGKTWQPVFVCRISLQTSGLTQDVACTFQSLHFPSPQVGYAVAYHGNTTILAKTLDGGATWRVSLALPDEGGKEGEVFFLNENTGFLRVSNGTFYSCDDGGQTWHQLSGAHVGGRPEMKFADPEVGWSIGYRTMAFTKDGRSWTSRDIGFPANVNAFAVPSRDRGYAVGNHGMIYRYRVVPTTYSAQGMIDAPLMPGFDSVVPQEVARLTDVVAQLRSKLPAAAPGEPGGQTSAPAGGQSGGFQQDTTAPSSGGAPIPTANSNAAGAGGFQQDTGTGPVPAGYVDSCCGPLIQQLETTANSFAVHAPPFSQRFRNLNLILEGLNFLNSVVNQANTLKQSIRALRQAKNAQAAAAALNTVSTQVNEISSTGGFVQDTTALPQP